MFRSSRTASSNKPTATCSRKSSGDDGVVEPDHRIVFAVLALGMLVGALLTTPAKSPAKLKAPGSAVTAASHGK